MDRLGTKAGLALCRFLLGLGEGGGFPASAKAVAEWFSQSQRSFAFGSLNTRSSLGAVIAPPLTAAIVAHSKWRAVFFAVGGAGLIWLVRWWWIYRTPESPITGAKEELVWRPDYHELFYLPQVWGLVAAKFLSDAAWYFFIFWLPKYLGDVRGLDIKGIAYFAWIPYAAARLGSMSAGLISSVLLRYVSLGLSRKIALGTAAALLPAALGISEAPLSWALFFCSIAILGHQAFSTIMQTPAADLFPASTVGRVAGLWERRDRWAGSFPIGWPIGG